MRLLKLLLFALAVAASVQPAFPMERFASWCEKGATKVLTAGVLSTTQTQASFPNCTVTVTDLSGNPVNIYSDNLSSPTPLTNPFSANSAGYFFFYAPSGRYNVTMQGGGPPSLSSPFTLGDRLLFDPKDLALFSTYGGICNGVADDTAAFQAIAALTNTTVWFHMGGTCMLSSNVTIPASVALRIDSGTLIQTNGGAVLTVQGDVSAGQYQIFVGGSSILLNGKLNVQTAWFGGSDIGAQTNAAIAAACAASPCNISMPSGATLTQTATINYPDKYVDLDLNGSILNYTGSSRAISVATSNVSYLFISGRIHDGQINGTSSGTAGIYHASRIGMVYENLRIGGFTTGSCMQWDNTVGGGGGTVQFNEQNTIRKADLENCLYGLRWTINGGTNSFAYNYISDVHFGVNDGQIGFSMEGTGATQTLFANGGYYSLRFNLNTATTPGKSISLTAGADWERSTVQINGEKTSGAATSYGLFKDTNSLFANFGVFQIDNTINTAPAGAAQLLYPIGFSTGVAPATTYTLDETGLTRFQADVRYGIPGFNVHQLTAAANSDMSFIQLINSGNTTGVHTFNRTYNNLPNCNATPNTIVLGPAGVGIGSWALTPTVSQLTVTMSNTQGVPVTFFITCVGNPD